MTKNVAKDRCEALRPRMMLKGILREKRKTQTLNGEKGKINLSKISKK